MNWSKASDVWGTDALPWRAEAMKEYMVNVREVHVQQVKIRADSPEQAIQKVQQGEGQWLNDGLEYSHTLDPENWTARELMPSSDEEEQGET